MRKSIITCVSVVTFFMTAWWATDPSIAADALRNRDQAVSGGMPTGRVVELEEVLIEGRRPETDTQKLRYWMDRLVGEFSYQGSVEHLGGNGTARESSQVHGKSRCVRFGSAAAVQCQISVGWPALRDGEGAPVPGGVSSLTSAVAVYSLEQRAKYIGYFNVDNDGVATGARGWLLDDTLIARAPCAEFPGKCERVMRLEALPDARVIRMRVDLERDGEVAVRYNFQWIRLAQRPSADSVAEVVPEPGAAPHGGGRASAAVPQDVDSWLRRMVGQYRVTQSRECRFVRGPDKAAGCTESRADAAVATRSGPIEAQCEGIGTGPGVRCAVHMEWPESGIPAKRPTRTSTPHFKLYGFDQVQRGIAELQVLPSLDTIGASQLFVGELADGELTHCLDQTCVLRGHTRIAPGGEWIRFANVSLFVGDPSVPEATAWRMYRVREGASVGSEETSRTPVNRSPRR